MCRFIVRGACALGYRREVSEKTQSTPASARVGDYRLLTMIGEGGMGVVHLAQASDGRRVALKVLRPHIVGDNEARERLAREVASLRRVKSPRIAEIIDADPWGPTPFVATRYVPGLSLHDHVKQDGPLAGDELRWFAAGLAEAVIAVHSVGVLHRDIKPSNVLLEGRAPVLIDFGLARLAEDPRLTVTGWLLGTPGYLAPEILYGDDATTASDVHSWAATVVFAATGQPPFGRGPAMSIMDRVRRDEHDLSAVPADMLPMIGQCLSPDPLDRPETAAVLADLRKADGSRTGRGARSGTDNLTMPFALFAHEDNDPTEVLGSGEQATVQTHVEPSPAPPVTRRLTTQMPPVPPVHEAARTPYMMPPQPQPQRQPPQQLHHQLPQRQPPQQPQWRPPSTGLPKLQRGSLLLAGLALVSVGFALAPYICLVLVAVATLGLRTVSWTTESGRDRQHRRGRARWYDGPLTVVTSPWYLLVATGGTLVLLLWAAALTSVVGAVYVLFGLPGVPGLLIMGAVLGVSLWWGPGSRRLRGPTRQLLLSATRWPWLGWMNVALLGAVVALCAFTLLTTGVNWDPQPGPPWRRGTILSDLAGFF